MPETSIPLAYIKPPKVRTPRKPRTVKDTSTKLPTKTETPTSTSDSVATVNTPPVESGFAIKRELTSMGASAALDTPFPAWLKKVNKRAISHGLVHLTSLHGIPGLRNLTSWPKENNAAVQAEALRLLEEHPAWVVNAAETACRKIGRRFGVAAAGHMASVAIYAIAIRALTTVLLPPVE